MQPRNRLNMTGPSPKLIKRAYLPATNADNNTIPVLDAVFAGRDDKVWGSADPDAPENLRTQGTVAFYVLCAAYMLIHNSQYFGILQRARFAGYCNMFAGLWRLWVIKKPHLNLGTNFLTKECYSDLVQSCHEAVLQMIVFRRSVHTYTYMCIHTHTYIYIHNIFTYIYIHVQVCSIASVTTNLQWKQRV